MILPSNEKLVLEFLSKRHLISQLQNSLTHKYVKPSMYLKCYLKISYNVKPAIILQRKTNCKNFYT